MSVSSPYPFFTEQEFKRCTPACSSGAMDKAFMDRLCVARINAGVPFKLNSAYRSRKYELEKGRTGNSYHCSGRAVDIHCVDSTFRAQIVRACLDVGLTCGIAGTFIHVDDRPIQKIFLY